jgi:hypothetical protein
MLSTTVSMGMLGAILLVVSGFPNSVSQILICVTLRRVRLWSGSWWRSSFCLSPIVSVLQFLRFTFSQLKCGIVERRVGGAAAEKHGRAMQW